MSPTKLLWYFYRVWSMPPAKVLGRVDELRKGLFLERDLRSFLAVVRSLDATVLGSASAWPRLPAREDAPDAVRCCVGPGADAIRHGEVILFDHLELQVATPPKWQTDYLVGKDLASDRSAKELNHRELPDGADSKLIWDLNRWTELTSLAQSAWLLNDRASAETCVAWLQDWVERNPVGRGWNWTSPLETGIRLIQICWIDALSSRLSRSRN